MLQTYDNWHVYGTQYSQTLSTPPFRSKGESAHPRADEKKWNLRRNDTDDYGSDEHSSTPLESDDHHRPIIARVSAHLLRLEREFCLNKAFAQTTDPNCLHVTKLIDLVHIPRLCEDDEPLVCSIFESPGHNSLRDYIDFGPAWIGSTKAPGLEKTSAAQQKPLQKIHVPTFLDFALGACESLELLHHGLRMVHGELRADAFHFNEETRAVKLVNFGSGPRSFDNGLTSRGWLSLSQELGIKHKLQFIAPEQTGRLPAEPDSRSDIYSLGIILWTLLAGKVAFEGENPIDVIQAVLVKSLQPISSARLDVPDVISNIIRRMTNKQVEDRYHSVIGLKYDLGETKRMLEDGESDALASFTVGTKDVSSFFMLPTKHFGRDIERARGAEVIKKVATQQCASSGSTLSNLQVSADTSSSVVSTDRRDSADLTRSSDTSSIVGNNHSLDLQTSDVRSAESTSQLSLRGQDHRASIKTGFESGSQTSGNRVNQFMIPAKEVSDMHRRKESHTSRRKIDCEVLSIRGSPGIGKSSLMAELQSDIRRQQGYFASAKFDPAKKAPFEPLLQAMSSLIRQIFSESDLNSEYHQFVASAVRPYWPSICSMLDLPESLLIDTLRAGQDMTSGLLIQNSSNSATTNTTDGFAISTTQSGSIAQGSLSCGPVSTFQSINFMALTIEILRIVATNKLISLCLDNIQYADNESLELLSKVAEMRLGVVIMVRLMRPLLKFINGN